MKLKPFALERYFAQHEFSAKYLLSSSDCDGLSMSEVLNLATREERKQWDELKLGYTESKGWPALRESIASLYQNILPEEVVVMSPGEVNFIAMHVQLEKGDHVICMAPAYQSLYEVVNGLGCELTFWNPAPNHNDWYYDPEDLKKLFRSNTKLLIINFPHNPTGYIPSQDEYQKIIQLAEEHRVTIFSDEMYHGLERNVKDRLTPLCEISDRGISLWGMAKTFALAGVRLGWMVCRDAPLREEIAAFKDYLTICSSGPSEVLSWIALNHHKVIVESNREKINTNIRLFSSFCDQHPETFTFVPPRAGSTGFVKLNLPETALSFSERLIKDTGIMTLPSEMFEFGDRHLRIGFGRKNMPETLSVLDHYLTTHS